MATVYVIAVLFTCKLMAQKTIFNYFKDAGGPKVEIILPTQKRFHVRFFGSKCESVMNHFKHVHIRCYIILHHMYPKAAEAAHRSSVCHSVLVCELQSYINYV